MMNIFIIVMIIIIILIIISLIIGNYFYNIALNPKTDKKFVLGDYKETDEYKKQQEEKKKWIEENSKDVYIKSSNNGILKLHAYEIINENKTNIWTIVIHGYMGQGIGMARYAKEFTKRGYNVLVVDLRGSGLSEGNYIGMGWHDRLDIIDWIKYIIGKNKDSKIMIFGISMGAATMMMTTGENLPENVKLAISDCGYTSAWDEFSYQLKKLFKVPEFPILYSADFICKIRAKYSIMKTSSLKQIRKSKTPTLFIHGNLDDFVPFYMLYTLYNNASCEKQKLVIEGANHGESSIVNPDLYWQTVDNFIEKYINR